MIRLWPTIPHGETPRKLFGSKDFKVCPLCGTLTTEDAPECLVCSWHGTFEQERALIDLKAAELICRCPELESMIESRSSVLEKSKTWIERLWIRFRLRLDVRA